MAELMSSVLPEEDDEVGQLPPDWEDDGEWETDDDAGIDDDDPELMGFVDAEE